MKNRIRVTCNSCGARYILDAKIGGRMGKCSQCDERFVLPIPCPERLLEWAQSAPWRRLTTFVDNCGPRGHCPNVVDQFVEIVTQRRFVEEHATYRQTSENGRSLSRREEQWQKSERKILRTKRLDELRQMDPTDFEKLVADIFAVQGLAARSVGRTADDGIDVKIWATDGSFWAIVQCKRYAASNRITSGQIREFAGAYLLSNARKGFYFTTSSYTRHAKRTARGYPWLTLYSGKTFVKYLESLELAI